MGIFLREVETFAVGKIKENGREPVRHSDDDDDAEKDEMRSDAAFKGGKKKGDLAPFSLWIITSHVTQRYRIYMQYVLLTTESWLPLKLFKR